MIKGEHRELLFSLAAGSLLLIGWLGERFAGFPPAVSLGLYLAAYGFGGYDITRHAIATLRARRFDTDLLMLVAALGAAALGEFAEGALLLFLFSLGHALEERALDRARSAVSALAELAPKSALVRREGVEAELPVEQVRVGDVVIIRPGSRIPVDGTVAAGHSAVDQSPVTGESVPVDKGPGASVFAGTINKNGALEAHVTRLAEDSTLARVMHMVEEAQAQKSPTQQTIERFSRIFVPSVIGVALLLIVVPPLFGVPLRDAFLRAMTLLVAASPCALALGTPATVLAGVAQAARHGVLIKGSAHLENLGRLRAIAFDKTGTITHGRPVVTDVTPLDGTGPDALLFLTAAAESRSAHPLARAIVDAAQAARPGEPFPAVSAVESHTGRGLAARVNGTHVLAGTLALWTGAGVPVSPAVNAQVAAFEAAGKTTVAVALDGRPAGLLALADTLRPGIAGTVAELRRLGIAETVMLTGDNERVAQAIAGAAGIASYRAALLPEDKLAAVRELLAQHGQVGMVGDGVNDAPALAHATVGIAMGGAGTDVALETADVALMGDDLSRLPFAIGLGRAARAVITQNLVIALGVIALLSVASVAGWTHIGTAVALHEGSTLVVVLNALRLLRYQ